MKVNNKKVSGFQPVIIASILLISFWANAQNNLQDIPDPDPLRQMEMFQVAEGFEVSLFASDPMVVKPIQMNWDAEGRLWVVSSTVYPHPRTGVEANDKIYVLEDTDGDGIADKSIVFAEGLLTPTGILPGDGGVYVANSTEILHLKDTDGDGKADQKRKILTGFGTGDTHHLIHTFRWGPEGLMYFNQSIYIYSHIETPWGVRRLEGGGVWQLRPETRELDVYAKGLINPWGIQFNRWGQSFLTDGAGGEGINYAFPGATFVTAPGAERIIRGLNPGQPKMSGLEVLSGKHLPESWDGSFITNDFRANRIIRFIAEEQGSGYATKQVEDLLGTDHVAFRPVDISVGPDGAIYVADWYNPIIQHGEVDFHDSRRDQEHGRIWRITAKDRPLVKPPLLGQASVLELLEALKMTENWTRSQAKQKLKEKGAEEVLPLLRDWIKTLDPLDPEYEHHLLEALWVHQAMDAVNQGLLFRLLDARDHNARAAAVRTLFFWGTKIDNLPAILIKAAGDKHPRVRLEALTATRHLKPIGAASTALSVVEQPMDEFLDFALWQTMRELESIWMPQLMADPDYFQDVNKTVSALLSGSMPEAIGLLVQLYRKGEVPEVYQPKVLEAIAKAGESKDLNIVFEMALSNSLGKNSSLDQLRALEQAAQQRNVWPNQGLGQLVRFLEHEQEAMVLSTLNLIGYWKMEGLSEHLAKMVQRDNLNIKKAALAALASLDNEKSKGLLVAFTDKSHSPTLRIMANAELVSLDVDQAAEIAVKLLQSLPENTEVTPLFSAFLSKKGGIEVLAQDLLENKIPESFAKAGRISMQQQLPSRRNRDADVQLLQSAFEASGGILPPEKMPQKLSPSELNYLTQDIKAKADPVLGESIYRRKALMCQNCHAIGGAGGLIGPDLSSLGTSSPIDNIIQSMLVPSLSIKEGYELQRIVKKDGSTIMGYQVSEGPNAFLMRNVAGIEESVPKSLIDIHEKIPGSLMPPGLTSGLEREEFINLVGYLSKLGESGEFRVPNSLFVRRWRAISGNDDWITNLRKEGIAYIVTEKTTHQTLPVYSNVSGNLPIEELPVFELGVAQPYSFVQFSVEVLNPGNVELLFNSTAGITAWAGQEPLMLNSRGIVAELSEGIHVFTLAFDRGILKEPLLNIQIQEAKNSLAQFRLVMGQ